MFPRNAVMDRKIFMAERKISSLSTLLINSTAQNSSMNVLWFSSSVKFVSAIFLCDRSNEVSGVRQGFIYHVIYISLFRLVESDIDDSHIIFNTLIHSSFFIYKNIFYKSIEA